MGNNPRRIYIFPRHVQEDDAAVTNGWQPDMTGAPQSSDDWPRYASSDYPENYLDQGGGLLGILLRGMQQDRDQPNVASRLASNVSPEIGSDSFSNPQSDLIGRLAAMRTEPTSAQPSMARDQLPLSDPRNPNFRQLSRAPMAIGASQMSGGLGAYGEKPLASIATAPTIKTAQLVLPGRGLPFPPGPFPGSPPPQIPMPPIPFAWKAIGGIAQMLPRLALGLDGRGDDGVAGSLGGATILNQKKSRGSGKANNPSSRDDDDEQEFDWEQAMEANRKRIAAAAKERGKAFSGNRNRTGYDPHDYCDDRLGDEQKNCYKRWRQGEMAHDSFLNGCLRYAEMRRDKCRDGDLDPDGLGEWGLDHEETYNRDFLSKKPLSD